MERSAYDRLTGRGRGDPFDRHVFACAVVIAVHEDGQPLNEALGLDRAALQAVCAAYFDDAGWLLQQLPVDAGAGSDALEEPDLRQLLLDHRSRGVIEEEWLAAVIARRSLRPNHLWQDLGLFARGELNQLLHRHFQPLAAQNNKDMKWKKFFYRALCARDGVVVCKAPTCDVCCDVAVCFAAEAGEPLVRLQQALSASRQNGRNV